jgi:hypothetical protein
VVGREDPTTSLFGWLVADGWCWYVLREEYCWLVAGDWFVVREKYCCLVTDKPSKQGAPLETAITDLQLLFYVEGSYRCFKCWLELYLFFMHVASFNRQKYNANINNI